MFYLEIRKATAGHLVNIGATVTVMRMITALTVRTTAGGPNASQQSTNEQILYELLWLLAQLSQKGKHDFN